MPCYSPLQAYRGKELTKKGKRKIVFNSNDAIDNSDLFKLQVGCGQCIGCRLERSRQWAVRLVHEASLHEHSCFITLTYSDDKLPKDNSLSVRDFQLFMKRLRKHFGSGIRFFHCGEYGDKYGRPHYHAIIFGINFDDKYLWSERRGVKLYRSQTLEKLWKLGHCSIGDVTFESAAYVARYVMKKSYGEASQVDYLILSEYGEITGKLQPEYVTMSRRPGIAKGWFDKWKDIVYRDDKVIMRNGIPMLPPKFYDSQYEIVNPSDFEKIKSSRVRNARKFKDNNTFDRLEVRRKVKLAKISNLRRSLDEEL